MSTSNIFDLADTWNDAAVTFNGIKLNVTDTASAAASNLLDLQVGGVSRFHVTKTGNIFANNELRFSITPKIFAGTGGGLAVDIAGVGTIGTVPLRVAFSQLTIRQPVSIEWSSGTNINSGSDLSISRDAANTLAQRNGTNPQAFRLYNTFTDASNFERLAIRWASNICEIKPEAGGTGTTRVLHISGLPTSDPAISGVLWNDAGTVKVSAG
jgi:hypothetical protein